MAHLMTLCAKPKKHGSHAWTLKIPLFAFQMKTTFLSFRLPISLPCTGLSNPGLPTYTIYTLQKIYRNIVFVILSSYCAIVRLKLNKLNLLIGLKVSRSSRRAQSKEDFHLVHFAITANFALSQRCILLWGKMSKYSLFTWHHYYTISPKLCCRVPTKVFSFPGSIVSSHYPAHFYGR